MPLLHRMRAVAARCRRLIDAVSHPYRPERHYMRGPGPRWRARNGGRD
jgi:hypothetical protein